MWGARAGQGGRGPAAPGEGCGASPQGVGLRRSDEGRLRDPRLRLKPNRGRCSGGGERRRRLGERPLSGCPGWERHGVPRTAGALGHRGVQQQQPLPSLTREEENGQGEERGRGDAPAGRSRDALWADRAPTTPPAPPGTSRGGLPVRVLPGPDPGQPRQEAGGRAVSFPAGSRSRGPRGVLGAPRGWVGAVC